jgi:hypothetical protein
MSELNSGMDFVMSAIDGDLPAGIECECSPNPEGGIRVKLTEVRGGKTAFFDVRARESEMLDSDALLGAIRPRIMEARAILNGPPPKKKRKSKKKAKAKRKSVKMLAATPEQQEAVDKALEPVGSQ